MTTHTFNLMPDTDALVAVFRESLRIKREQLDALSSLIELIECDQHRHIRPEGADKEYILDGLRHLENQCIDSIHTTNDALDECELAIEANELIRSLNAERDFSYSVQNNVQMGDFFNHAVAVIAKIAEKAGMKG